MSAKQHRHSYNPFAVRGLLRFMGGNWVILTLILFLLIGGSVWLIKRLPAWPPSLLLSEPTLVSPGELDWETQSFRNRRISMRFSPGDGIHPAIDPDGVLCPVMTQTNSGENRIDLLNLKSGKTIFIGAFQDALASNFAASSCYPLYRPVQDEILVVVRGVEGGMLERLIDEHEFNSLFLTPQVKSVIHRFAAANGAYRGLLEIPQSLLPLDVSPDGSQLLASVSEHGSAPMAQMMIVDLNSGRRTMLPFEGQCCFFESDDAILAFVSSVVVRYHLQEGRVEPLRNLPPEGNGGLLLKGNFHPMRISNRLDFLFDYSENSIATISLDGKATLEKWHSPIRISFDLGGCVFQPERELFIKGEYQQSGNYTYAICQLRTGDKLLDVPPQVVRINFLNKDFLWVYTGNKSHLVRIDELLDGTFQFNFDEPDK